MSLQPRRPSVIRLFSAVALFLLVPQAATRADLTVAVEDAVAYAGTTDNALEVTLRNSGRSSLVISSFAFELTVSSADITFTRVTIDTQTFPYIFQDHSLFGPDITNSTGQNPAEIQAVDQYDTPNTGFSLDPGMTVALGRVFFDVSSSASPELLTVTLTPYPSTSLSGPDPNNIPIDTLQNGSIAVRSVPEPSSFCLLALGLTAAIPRLRRLKPSSRKFPAWSSTRKRVAHATASPG